MKKIVLASSSPRRIEMMKNNGYTPEIMPAEIDETLPLAEMSPQASSMYLALKKAMHTANILKSREPVQDPADNSADGCIIIAADTIVVHAGRIIGKPRNQVDAYLTLTRLRNSCHQVITGVCIVDTATGSKTCFFESTDVYLTHYTDEELNAYVDTDEPYDKAGGYAIQGTFKKYIDHIDGDFDNVVGFPWTRIESFIRSTS